MRASRIFGLIVPLYLIVACEPETQMPQAVAPAAGPPQTATLTLSALPIRSAGTQSPGRRLCTSVILFPGENGPHDEKLLSLVEGHLISGGLNVRSAAITGRVVSEPTQPQVEGAAKLSQVERALIMAKKSGIDCIVQIFTLNVTEEVGRYYVLPANRNTFQEASLNKFMNFEDGRRWYFTAEGWRIDGKVIDVDNGSVLAIIGLAASPLGRAQTFELSMAYGKVLPVSGSWSFRLGRDEDVAFVRDQMMGELVREIRGPVSTRPASP